MDHLGEVMEIERLSFPTPWSKQFFVNELKYGIASLFVAVVPEKGGHERVVGYIVCGQVLDEVHIQNLAVHPRFRRKGVATRLLTYIFNHFGERGVSSFYLEVRSKNPPALNLYKKMGFIPIGVRKGYYSDTKDDAIVMKLELRDEEKRV